MEWLILFAAMVFYSISLLLCYSQGIRSAWYYVPLALSIGLCTSLMWTLSVKIIDNKEKIFFFSLCWEFLVILVDCLIPIVFFGISANKYMVIGSVIVVLGLIVMRLNTH